MRTLLDVGTTYEAMLRSPSFFSQKTLVEKSSRLRVVFTSSGMPSLLVGMVPMQVMFLVNHSVIGMDVQRRSIDMFLPSNGTFLARDSTNSFT